MQQLCETSSVFEVERVKNGAILPRKSEARSYEALHLSRKIVLGNLKIWNWRSDAPKCNLSKEISTLTSQHLLWTCLLCCARHATCIVADPLQTSHVCHRFWNYYKKLHVLLTFGKVQNPLRLPHKVTLERPRVVRMWCAFHFLTSKCHHHALFQHLNFQSWLDGGVLSIWTSKTASCGVQFLISHLARWLCACRFCELTFRPSGATKHLKNTLFCNFWPFPAPGFPSLFFHLSILSEVWLLNFPRIGPVYRVWYRFPPSWAHFFLFLLDAPFTNHWHLSLHGWAQASTTSTSGNPSRVEVGRRSGGSAQQEPMESNT